MPFSWNTQEQQHTDIILYNGHSILFRESFIILKQYWNVQNQNTHSFLYKKIFIQSYYIITFSILTQCLKYNDSYTITFYWIIDTYSMNYIIETIHHFTFPQSLNIILWIFNLLTVVNKAKCIKAVISVRPNRVGSVGIESNKKRWKVDWFDNESGPLAPSIRTKWIQFADQQVN